MAKRKKLSKAEIKRRAIERRVYLRQLVKEVRETQAKRFAKRSESAKKGVVSRTRGKEWVEKQLAKGRRVSVEFLKDVWKIQLKKEREVNLKISKIVLDTHRKTPLTVTEMADLMGELREQLGGELDDPWRLFRGEYAKRKK